MIWCVAAPAEPNRARSNAGQNPIHCSTNLATASWKSRTATATGKLDLVIIEALTKGHSELTPLFALLATASRSQANILAHPRSSSTSNYFYHARCGHFMQFSGGRSSEWVKHPMATKNTIWNILGVKIIFESFSLRAGCGSILLSSTGCFFLG